MTIAEALFTSDSTEYTTPRDLFDRCNDRWGPFDLDAAATQKNRLVSAYFSTTLPDYNMRPLGVYHGNALTTDWWGRVWCNPPYGREIGVWVKRAYEMVDVGFAKRVVMLLPARTDTRWWQQYCCSEIATRCYLKGRLKFGGGNGSQNSAPFPSAIVVFERTFQ